MDRVLISHSRADDAVFLAVASALEFSQYEIWSDIQNAVPGDPLPLKISDGIKICDGFVLLISRNYLNSNWCERELSAVMFNSVQYRKPIIVVSVDDAPVPEIIADLLTIKCDTRDRSYPDMLKARFRDIRASSGLSQSRAPEYFVRTVINAERAGRYGEHLIAKKDVAPLQTLENDGLIFIKPGGTFYEPCLQEIFKRILKKCRVRQIRLFTGSIIKDRGLFDEQYVDPVLVAKGHIRPKGQELELLRGIYDKPAFEEHFGTAYSDDLILPAYALLQAPYNLSPERVTEFWDQGRSYEKFWNKRWDGLNKIGYHTSVFPIAFSEPSPSHVRLVLNGFVFGFKSFLEEERNRVVAIHVSTLDPWINIKHTITGPHNNPQACPEGSIRRDAYEGILPLDPRDNLVNGQRNIIHCSGTDYDGVRELTLWFEYRPSDTLAGQVFRL